MGNESFILFALPTFLSGVAAVFDPADALRTYNESPTGMDADAIATYADWKAVGIDLAAAVKSEEDRGKAEKSKI